MPRLDRTLPRCPTCRCEMPRGNVFCSRSCAAKHQHRKAEDTGCYLPSPEQIARELAAIQSTWDDRERYRRAGLEEPRFEVPEPKVLT